jgi:hypothetical protein
MRAAAELAIECLDEDPIAAHHFEKGDYRAVMDRYAEQTPDSHVLAVVEAPLMEDPDNFFETVVEVKPRRPSSQ